jgi:selenocysteine lyase/cysteine desulfurase
VLLPNATAGLNVALQSCPLLSSDSVFALSVGYGAVKTLARFVASRAGASFVEAAIRFPLTRESLLEAVRDQLPLSTKLAVFDAVTSNTALTLPIADLVELVRLRCPCAVVVVDAAHSLGSVDLPHDVPGLGVDVWVSNLHKHLCNPRGCAVLWASEAAKEWLKPLIVSHGTGSGLTSAFVWDGNRDYSPWLAIPATLRWWAAVGPSRALAHVRQTLASGCAALLTRWQTHLLAPLALSACNMALVRLPAAQPGDCVSVETLLAREPPSADGPANSDAAKQWQDRLFARGIEVPAKCVQGYLYVRVSVAIYNTVADFEKLGNTVLELLRDDTAATNVNRQ